MAKMQLWGFIGDLHLNKLNRFIDNHLDLQFTTLDQIIERMKEKGITTVVLLGDVLDKPEVEIYIIIRLLEWIEKHKDLQFKWICGNHDKNSDDAVQIDLIKFLATMGAISNLDIYVEPTKDGAVSFLPYPHKKLLSKTKLGIAHCDRPNARRDNGNIIVTDGKWQEDFDFVIGHNHTNQVIKKTRYTGSPYQLSFGEKVDKFWGFVKIKNSVKDYYFKYKDIPIVSVYQLINLTITSKKQLKKLEPAPTYYKLTIKGVKLPSDFFLKHPNCFQHGDLPRSVEEGDDEHEFLDNEVVIDPLYGLSEYLTRKSLDKSEIKWAIKQVKKLVGKSVKKTTQKEAT